MHDDDDDAKAILKRRARYVAMALAGVGTATQATACVCLDPAPVDARVPDSAVDALYVPVDANIDAHFVDDVPWPDTGDVAVERDVGPSAVDANDGDGASFDATTSSDASETDARDEDAP